jgi:murein DD-endopeptidase MepM/ murein hydrolase activator NlpD
MRSVAFSGVACAVKRAAFVFSVLAVAGCSSRSARFDGYGFDAGFAHASTGSVPRGDGYDYRHASVERGLLPPISASYEDGPRIAPGHKTPGSFQTSDGYGRYQNYGAYDRPDESPPPPRHSGYATGGREIIVAPGDTLYGLALQHGVSAREIEEANGLGGGRQLRAGQSIVIPAPGGDGPPPPPRERAPSYSNGRHDGGNGGYNGSSRRNGGGYEEGYDAGAAYTSQRTPPPPRGETCPNCYTVKSGDTLFTIGERYGVGPAPIAHHNRISPGAKLRPGQVLIIPEDGPRPGRRSQYEPQGSPERYAAGPSPSYDAAPGRQPYLEAPRNERGYEPSPEGRRETHAAAPRDRVEPSTRTREEISPRGRAEQPALRSEPERKPQEAAPPPQKEAAKQPDKATAPTPAEPQQTDCEDMLANPLPRSADTFRVPVDGLLISKFGKKDDGTFNDGVNYSVPKGTPVKAAENGVVAYVGTEISGFGNLILIRHAGDYVTAYAHNDEVLVKRCDIVKRGQVVAKAGATGNVTKPQLHFELRKNSKPVNPEEFFTAAKEP